MASSTKPRTRKIAASCLKPGMTIYIPAQRGTVVSSQDANKITPSLSQGILYVEMKASTGPWKGTTGKTLVLEHDMVEIEMPPSPLRRLAVRIANWLAG